MFSVESGKEAVEDRQVKHIFESNVFFMNFTVTDDIYPILWLVL